MPYSPCQNAKQESFWATLEGRLMAMLEAVADLTLERLNGITQAWVEQDYHRTLHSGIGVCPLRRYRDSPTVGRDCPDSETLRRAFRSWVTRRQRRSNGTLSLAGVRFEVPARYRHLETLPVSYARWDLSAVDLIDPDSMKPIRALHPLDKTANAAGNRRYLPPKETQPPVSVAKTDPNCRHGCVNCWQTMPPPAFRQPIFANTTRQGNRPMNPKLLARYGLKYNPFSPELPIEALYRTAKSDNFCWRIEHSLVREGGFALITGDPGTGKSVVLRILADRLSAIREITVGAMTRPGSNLADFYRERQGICAASNSNRITDGAASNCSGNAGSPAPPRHPAQARSADRRSPGNAARGP